MSLTEENCSKKTERSSTHAPTREQISPENFHLLSVHGARGGLFSGGSGWGLIAWASRASWWCCLLHNTFRTKDDTNQSQSSHTVFSPMFWYHVRNIWDPIYRHYIGILFWLGFLFLFLFYVENTYLYSNTYSTCKTEKRQYTAGSIIRCFFFILWWTCIGLGHLFLN